MGAINIKKGEKKKTNENASFMKKEFHFLNYAKNYNYNKNEMK